MKAIVVIKPCCLGDVLMATAVVGQLRRLYPRARLAFAVSDWAQAAVAGNPDIDEIVPCGRVAAGARYSVRDYLSLVGRLRRGHYDLAVVLERSAFLTLLPLLAGIPQRAGIDSGGRGFTLTARAPCRGMRHEVELYLDTLRALGLPVENPHLRFQPSPLDRARAKDLLEARGCAVSPDQNQGSGSSPLVMIHAGGGANPGMVLAAKQWLPERFAEVARRLLAAGSRVVLVGSATDRGPSDEVRARLDGLGERVIDLTGKTTIGQLGALLALGDLFVGNDSGPTHLAVAVGTPTVAVFGPSTPEMYGPFGPRATAVYVRVDCSPCFLAGSFARDCTDHRCQQAVQVDEVWDAILRVLDPSRLSLPSGECAPRA